MGLAGVVRGAAEPEPLALVHPFKVWVTVKIPALFTISGLAVEPLLHIKEPVTPVGVSVEVPLQLFTTDTPGVGGIGLMVTRVTAATLAHPLTVAVTLYVPDANVVTEPIEGF